MEINSYLETIINKLDILITILSHNTLQLPQNNKEKSLIIAEQNNLMLFDWLQDWLDCFHKNNVSTSTYKNDCGILNNHVFKKMHFNKPLWSYTLTDLNSLVNDCKFSRQRQILANFLVDALKIAYADNKIKQDITVRFKKPKHDYELDRALTKVEEKRFLKGIVSHEYGLFFKFLLYTGLRRNEALGLQRKHLDFKNGVIKVEQQKTLDNKITCVLKTKTSYRIVKMFPQILIDLEQFKALKENEFIFDYLPQTVTKSFKAFSKSIKINNVSLKSLRTTFGTRCKEYGLADEIIQCFMGHGSFKTTKNHYIKINQDYIENSFKKIIKNIK